MSVLLMSLLCLALFIRIGAKPLQSTQTCTEELPFPHPTNCAKFQVCAPWGLQVMDCAPGTQFSNTIKVCVHPDNSGCGTSPTTSSSTIAPECTETLPFPHPTDCSKFKVCTPWGPQVMDCAPGTQFSHQIRVCVHPDNSGCAISPTTSSSTNSSSTTPSLTTSSPTTLSSTTTPECTETLPFPHPTDCSKFQVCTPWGPQVMDCAPGTQFSPQIRVCVNPDNSGCAISPTTSSSSNSSSTTSSSTTSSSTTLSSTTTPECTETLPFPHPTDCSKFQVCTPGGPQVMDCAPGTQFSPQIRVCVHPDNSGCAISLTTSSSTNSSSTTPSSTISSSTTSSSTTTPECTETLPFPHPTDCSKFQVCTPEGPQVMDCAPGTQFSPQIRVCVHPDNSECAIFPTNPSTKTSSSTTPSSTTISSTTTPECTETLPFPHPTDCSKFQVCTPGGPQVMNCTPGTQFSPIIGVCVHSDNSGCATTSSSTTSSSTSSSSTSSSSTTSTSTTSTTPSSTTPSSTTPSSTTPSSTTASSTSSTTNTATRCTETLPFPHPTNCSKFQVCSPSGLHVLDCSPGTQFDPQIHVCVRSEQTDGCITDSAEESSSEGPVQTTRNELDKGLTESSETSTVSNEPGTLTDETKSSTNSSSGEEVNYSTEEPEEIIETDDDTNVIDIHQDISEAGSLVTNTPLSSTRASTELSSEIPTKVPTVASTEILTQDPNEPPTEAPTEAPTELSTEATTGVSNEGLSKTSTESPQEASTKSSNEIPTGVSVSDVTEGENEVHTEASTAVPTSASSKASTEVFNQFPTNTITEFPTELPTEARTAAHTKASTDVTTESFSESSTKVLTKAPTEVSTEPEELSTEASTEILSEFSTEASSMAITAEASTEAATEATTKTPTEASTEAPTEASTKPPTNFPTDLSTEAATKSSKKYPGKAPTNTLIKDVTEATIYPTVSVTKAPELICSNSSGSLFFPHPSNCNEFLGCFDGILFTLSCFGTTPYFDPKNHVCSGNPSVCLAI